MRVSWLYAGVGSHLRGLDTKLPAWSCTRPFTPNVSPCAVVTAASMPFVTPTGGSLALNEWRGGYANASAWRFLALYASFTHSADVKGIRAVANVVRLASALRERHR